MLRIAGLPERPAYPVKQVAMLFAVEHNTIYRMIACGELKAIRLGATNRSQSYYRSHRPYKLRIDWTSLIELIAESDE